MKIADPLIFMVYPWGNFKSSYNGQDIEYLLKKVRISGKFNVLPTACVIACKEASPNALEVDAGTNRYVFLNFCIATLSYLYCLLFNKS